MKPTVKLIGENGNIFNLLAIATRALKQEGLIDQTPKMKKEVFASKSYEEALGVIEKYVEIE